MKNRLFILFAAAALTLCLAACKGSEENRPENGTDPAVSDLPNAQNGYYAGSEPVNNGIVTDGNGFIGDDDDRRVTKPKTIGDTVEKFGRDVGSAIDNTTSHIESTVSEITDKSR